MNKKTKTEPFTINHLASVLHCDRRTLKKLLANVQPADYLMGNPRFELGAVQAVLEKHFQKKNVGATARERLLALQAEKLSVQIGILKKDYVLSSDVEKWTGQMIAQAKAVLLPGPASLAPQVVGLTIIEAEKLLREWLHAAMTALHENPLGNKNEEN